MKLLKNFILLATSISLIACGSDDDSTPAYELNEENFVGTYAMTDYNITTTTTAEVAGDEVIVVDEETDEALQSVELIFTDADTYEVTGFITRNIERNDEVETEGEIINAATSGTYVLDIEDREIIFTTSDSTTDFVLDGTFSIESFTTSRLIIGKEDEGVNDDGDSVVSVESFSFDTE